MFFSENDATGERVGHEAVVTGDLQLVSVGAANEVLADDSARMLAGGMPPGEHEPFDVLMERRAAIDARVNELMP